MTSQFKTMFLLALLSGLIIVLGGAVGGRGGIMIALAFALVMNIGSYWYSDKIELHYEDTAGNVYHKIYDNLAELFAKPDIELQAATGN